MATTLSTGRLKSPTGVIGDYVIEWRLGSVGGTTVFVSGEGSDPVIQAQHPIVEEVVQSGTLYPVVKYVYINTEKYTSEVKESGAYFSPDLVSCLNPIVIDTINCDTVNAAGDYPFELSYNNQVDVGQDKSRTFSYYIGADTDYLAWYFHGSLVADNLKLYYCTVNDANGVLFENIIHGDVTGNETPIDYPASPKVIDNAPYSYQARSISDLRGFTYGVGDYIKVEITGSVYDPNVTNTDWILKFKCMTAVDIAAFTFPVKTIGALSAITVTPTHNIADCYYYIRYDNQSAIGDFTGSLAAKYISSRHEVYFNPDGTAAGNSNQALTTVGNGNRFQISTYNYFFNYVTTDCYNLEGTEEMTINKTDGNLLISFANGTIEYDRLKTQINTMQATTEYANAQAAVATHLDYYTAWYFIFRNAVSCGDTYTDLNYYISMKSSVITFDDVNKTINITCPTVVNGYIGSGDCDTTISYVSSRVSIFNSNSTAVNSFTTKTRKGLTVAGMRYGSSYVEETNRSNEISVGFHATLIPTFFDMEVLGFYKIPYGSHYVWKMYKANDRLTISDTTDEASILASMKLERKAYLRTQNYADDYYEQVYPVI